MNSTPFASSIASLSDYREYVLAEIRCAALRAQLLHNDIVTIGLALKGHLINADDALAHLSDCDALRLISPITTAST